MGRSGDRPPLEGRGRIYGTYIHGIFDAPGVAGAVLVDFAGLGRFDPAAYKERQYDLLADAVRGGLDMDLVYRVINREV